MSTSIRHDKVAQPTLINYRDCMKKISLHFLLEHAATLLTGTLLGATITAGITYENSVDFWQTVSSLSAGFGTVGLLIFGWVKADSWIEQNKSNARISLIIDTSNRLIDASESFNYFYRTNRLINATSEERKFLKTISEVKLTPEFHSHTNQISILIATLKSTLKTKPNSELDLRFRKLVNNLLRLTPTPSAIENLEFSEKFQEEISLFVIDTKSLQLAIIDQELH